MSFFRPCFVVKEWDWVRIKDDLFPYRNGYYVLISGEYHKLTNKEFQIYKLLTECLL